ncbi:MAG: YhcN/YlaJ family sporulation lipoprotein [Vulcanibacillus sp.]
MKNLKMLYILIILVILVGCQSTTKTTEINNNTSVEKTNNSKEAPSAVPEPERDQSSNSVANRLANLASRIPQVNDATVIVFGDYAIVGIDVDAKLDRSRVGVIKYSVAEALKEDPLGANALVTSDPDIIQRLREINIDLKNGHLIKGLAEELSDIVGRIMPIAPKSVEHKEEVIKDKNISAPKANKIEE